MNNVDSIPALIRQLYGVVSELEDLFPGRKFTPDGHLVGSIGEVVGGDAYNFTIIATRGVGFIAAGMVAALFSVGCEIRASRRAAR